MASKSVFLQELKDVFFCCHFCVLVDELLTFPFSTGLPPCVTHSSNNPKQQYCQIHKGKELKVNEKK